MIIFSQVNQNFLSAPTISSMEPLTSVDHQIIDIIMTTDPSDNATKTDSDERQITTRVIVQGPARNAYVTFPENSPLLAQSTELPALLVIDTLPISNS